VQTPELSDRAWLASGALSCHEGVLELVDRRLRYVTRAGTLVFDVDVDEAAVDFPWLAAGCGLTVSERQRVYQVWFANPYLQGGGAGHARRIARLWRERLKPESDRTR
jgi:hypothetical protein